jgi:hypothetical protein
MDRYDWNEDWYFLVFDEDAGTFHIEHEWSYVQGKNDSGSKTLPLAEAKREWPHAYEKAIAALRQKVFTGKDTQ